MILPDDVSLLATVCNTTPNAVGHALWLARGAEQFLVDLSDVLGRPGDGGLTGITSVADSIYVAVQSTDAARILILDHHLVPVGTISSPEFRDIHSIHGTEGALLVCSTGAQSVLRVDIKDHSVTRLCQFNSSIHLNSACLDESRLLICCHYAEYVVACAIGGGVIDAINRAAILVGLTQPHSLRPDGGGFMILDSDGRRLIRFDHSGIRQEQSLSGFLRGLTAARGSLFVASSAGRVISRKDPAVPPGRQFWQNAGEPVAIHELDEATLAVKATHFPLIAGFEIYELIAFDGAAALAPSPERLVAPDQNAIARVYYEAAKRALAEAHRRR